MYESLTRYINAFDNWGDLPDRQRVLEAYLHDLDEVADRDYRATIERFGLRPSLDDVCAADVKDAPAELVIALLTFAYRADCFNDGVLGNHLIPGGCVSRLLRRLRELDS